MPWKAMTWEQVDSLELDEWIEQGKIDLDEWMASHAAFDDWCEEHDEHADQ